MANNYIEFSEMIHNLNDEEQKYWEKLTDDERIDLSLEEHKKLQIQWESVGGTFENGAWPGFQWSFESRKDGNKDLWIYVIESGDIDNLAIIIQDFLKVCRPDGYFTLTWAETCSKPRLQQFGGGYLLITKDEIKADNVHNMVYKLKKDWESENEK
jgi:hypothetical protein